jgi:hypothetical protein
LLPIEGYHFQSAQKNGATKRESISTLGYGIGDSVGVKNHGDKWELKAYLISIDFQNRFASVKWKTTRKTKTVSIFDLYRLEDAKTKQENGNRQTSCFWTTTRIPM